MDEREDGGGVGLAEIEPSAALQAFSPADALSMLRSPEFILGEAQRAAAALMQVISGKKNKVMMNDEQYIEHEDWLIISAFYGCTPQLESDEFVEFGDVAGWEATYILKSRDGRVIGRATAMCLNDEEKWGTRPKYEWVQLLNDASKALATLTHDGKPYARRSDNVPSSALVWEEVDDPTKPGQKKRRPVAARLLVGEERVPLFQLRSMASTRASAKVQRMVFGFVPPLAGYNATPAEELDTERVAQAKPVGSSSTTASTSTSTARPPATSTNGNGAAHPAGGKTVKPITEPQIRRLWTIVSKHGASEERVAERIRDHYKCATTGDLTMAQYDELIREIEGGGYRS